MSDRHESHESEKNDGLMRMNAATSLGLNLYLKQEKPINCGTKGADVQEDFYPVNNANRLNILVHLQLLHAQCDKQLWIC